MKRLVGATLVAAVSLIPAMSASAVPGGSQNTCFVATPAGSAHCNFLGSGTAWSPPDPPSSDFLGWAGYSSGSWTVTHMVKVSIFDANYCVTGYRLQKVIDDEGGEGYFVNSADTKVGLVYTLTITGPGEGSAGGRGTPGPDSVSEPADATLTSGAEDGTYGMKVGDCLTM
jgi:hypothetical protein